MKHKVQESLDALCGYAMVYQEDYDWDENPCGEYVYMEDYELDELRNPIQDLINCQLTVEEVEVLISALLPFTMTKGTKETKQEALNLIFKLQKQKEMWVEE